MEQIKLWLAGLAVTAVSLSGAVAWYYKHEYETSIQRSATVDAALGVQKAATADALKAASEWKASAVSFQEALAALAKVKQESHDMIRRLDDVLDKHDLSALALKKPGLVEARVNRASASARRMLEDASR